MDTTPGSFNLSSPNRMVWQHFEALRRLAAGTASTSDDTHRKQDVMVCIMLAIAAVETFINVFFRVMVTENGFTDHEKRVLDDLSRRRSLDYKLRNWPRGILGKGIDFTAPVPAGFTKLKEKRNRLMHFTSTHQTLKLANVEIRGLAETSDFETLTPEDAREAVDLSEGMVKELCRLRGAPAEHLDQALAVWTGRLAI